MDDERPAGLMATFQELLKEYIHKVTNQKYNVVPFTIFLVERPDSYLVYIKIDHNDKLQLGGFFKNDLDKQKDALTNNKHYDKHWLIKHMYNTIIDHFETALKKHKIEKWKNMVDNIG